jgi:hypothetical protein
MTKTHSINRRRFIGAFLAVAAGFAAICGFTNIRVARHDTAEGLMTALPGLPADRIPVLAWGGVSPKHSTADHFRTLEEAGFTHNLTSHYPSVELLETAMNAAGEAGIKVIADIITREGHTHGTAEITDDAVKRLWNHPALAGWYIGDEPGRAQFPEYADRIADLQAVYYPQARMLADEHFCYANLLPNYAGPKALGTPTYREHVRTFLEEVPVPFLSFDHYPIRLDKDGNRVVSCEWYENLEVIADEAKRVGKPFWAFALSAAHVNYPVPTLADLRLQVYSDLAYGAQGIQYFTYWHPGYHPYTSAPVDTEGKKTEVYDRVKTMNEEIKNLSKVFLGARMISVGHTGTVIPDGTVRLGKLPKVIKKLETESAAAVFPTTVRGQDFSGAVVSQLEKGAERFLVIVNRDVNRNMKVKIKTAASVQRFLKDGAVVPAGPGLQTVEVAPGDALIYGWKVKN